VARSIVRDVVGFDLNPLAVIAARTNYLLALGPLLRELPRIEIPVYLCDSILAPTGTDVGLLGEEFELRTSVGVFRIPEHIVASGQLSTLTGLIDACLRDGYSTEEFLDLAKSELDELPELSVSTIGNLYRDLHSLRDQNKDGIWARIIRNAFAPITSGIFDFVLGNPPWVNWQSLVAEYRSATMPLWVQYGLFSLKGHAARLGGGKKDLAALMLYRSADAYLRSGGRLGFVITQTLFKSKGAGDGFRRFRIGDGAQLGVQTVHDLTRLQPFEGATTQSAVVILQKGPATEYPVQYMKWRKTRRITGISGAHLLEVRAACELDELAAAPIDAAKATSPWLTAPPAVTAGVRPVLGASSYRAFAGVCTWANGIYWIDVKETAPGGLLRIRNLADEAKDKNVEPVDALVEKTHVHPLVRSRDISRWHAQASTYILVPQDPAMKRGIPEGVLRVQASKTYRYLKRFEPALLERSGMKKYFDAARDPFYSVYNVGTGTFSPYKVMWRQMVPMITAAVVGPTDDGFLGRVPPVTQHVVSVIATETEDEAHYICAMLNSAVATSISASYSTGKSFGTPSMLEHVPIPGFDPVDEMHRDLVRLSRKAHSESARGRSVATLEDEIDGVACEVFGVENSFLPDLQAIVRELDRREEPYLLFGDEDVAVEVEDDGG
jgi:hypothetical protein